jgi:hypothetical protein
MREPNRVGGHNATCATDSDRALYVGEVEPIRLAVNKLIAGDCIWAYEELLQGVNWFRHLLGLGYVIATAVHLALALGS